MDNRHLYNSKIIDIYIKYIKKHHPDINLKEMLLGGGMKLHEVNDPGHWFTQQQIDDFYEKAVQLTQNKNLAREAGRYAASANALGIVKYWTLGLLSPGSVFRVLNKASSIFTRSARYEANIIAGAKVEITVTPHPGVQEKPFQCENRIGFFEAIVSLFGCYLHRIEHPECLFRGDGQCRYLISWKSSRKAVPKRLILGAGLLSLATLPAVLAWLPGYVSWHLAGSVLTVSLLKLLALAQENNELKANIDILQYTGDQLLEQVDINYRNCLLTYEIGAAVTKQTRVQEILNKVMELLESRLDYDRGLVLLADTQHRRLIFQAGFGYTDQEFTLLEESSFNLQNISSRGVFVLAFRNHEPILVNDLQDIKDDLSAHSLEIAHKLGTRSFICCPILYESQALGILAVDNKVSKRPLVERDMSFLMGIAHFIGVSLHNTHLLESKEKQFKSLIQTLAASIDARDPNTAGHSEQVAFYSMGICSELNIPPDTQEMIQVAALLHDYGKLAVPDSILKKPGPLTAEEYASVQLHAEQTRVILQQIHFEGVFSHVPDIAAAHHERLDGSGYPQGLRGEEIPYPARIIAVADFFEAITAKRPYREPIAVQEALHMLEERKDVLFDEEIVDALKAYLAKSRDLDVAWG
ncbi:HD domain-containing phosphohydrolase [Desulfovermiculus halophilus]|uniref:HD domain-containing phosphohydrolase n=1 Tax=Desulfovermiculus halophilus TaxID=339722 RepID=UPI0004842AB9|nr:HD domain-containing phosphohydrolase [Desulfovermiculus halophilus]